MRKKTKANLLEIIKTIYDAHKILEKLIKKNDNKSFSSLLGDCQDVALSIGNTIIESESEECITVSYIEKYCKSLFDIYNQVSEGTLSGEAVKILNRDLTDIKKSVEKDIKVRLEVVFLPYKASMWDSLESVWKAADEDPECDAYVVPIPYYDRNPDHSFGEFHYEGGEYPDYVPVTHYNNYDISKRRPDVIYIHNPYDDCNYVTSVDPRFYSRELKKYTDKLVYIPYFVLDEPDPDNPKSVESVAHFVITPGVLNADKVIVQSEAMKQTYIKALLKELGDRFENRHILENKIIGTGSPKFEKIVATSKDNIDIPDEWLKIIRKKDGTWKKIIFYNTGISTFLENNEMMINKIQNVLRAFYEYRENIVLLWRPHPLIKATLESMRPSLSKPFLKIKDKYISDGWGIYDDTSDVDRAVVLSDAFYGDPSSVTALFHKLNKPVLLENVFCSGSAETVPFFSECCIEANNHIYASAYNFNGLIRFDSSDKSITYLNAFSGYSLAEERLYNSVVRFENMLVFIPMRSSHISVYSLDDGSITMHKLNKVDSTYKFMGGVVYNDYIILIPYSYHSFVRFYPENGKIEYIFSLPEIFPDKKVNDTYFEYSYSCDEERIYLPVTGKNCVMTLKISEMKYSLNDIPQIKTSLPGICCLSNKLWMTGCDSGEVYRKGLIDSKLRCIDISDDMNNENLNYECVRYGRYLIIFPIQKGYITYIDTETEDIGKIDLFSMIFGSSNNYKIKWGSIAGYFFFKDELYLFDNYKFGLYKFLLSNEGLSLEYVSSFTEKKCILTNKYNLLSNSNEEIMQYNIPICETELYGLFELIKDLLSQGRN